MSVCVSLSVAVRDGVQRETEDTEAVWFIAVSCSLLQFVAVFCVQREAGYTEAVFVYVGFLIRL